MRLNTRSGLAAVALVAVLGLSALPSPATSATARKGSSCAKPWMVGFNHETGQDIFGNRGRISLKKKGDPFTDPQINRVHVWWTRKSGVRVICSSTGSINAGKIVRCSSNTSWTKYRWRSKGPGNGWCDLEVPAGQGNNLGPMKVTGARRR